MDRLAERRTRKEWSRPLLTLISAGDLPDVSNGVAGIAHASDRPRYCAWGCFRYFCWERDRSGFGAAKASGRFRPAAIPSASG